MLPFRPTMLLRVLVLFVGMAAIQLLLNRTWAEFLSPVLLMILAAIWVGLAEFMALVLWILSRALSWSDNPWVTMLMVDRDHVGKQQREHLHRSTKDNPTLR